MSELIKECDGACEATTASVSAQTTSLESIPGIGNAQPAKIAAMTGAEQTGTDCIGSGDKWTGLGEKKDKKTKKYKIGIATQKGVEVMKTSESLEEAKKELAEISKIYADAKIYELG